MWKRSLLYILLLQLLISSVLPRVKMRGSSMARLSSKWNAGSSPHSFSPHSIPASGVSHVASSGSSGSSFKNALIGGALGAAGGMLAVEAGKAMFHSPNKHPVNYMEGGTGRQCSMPLNEMTRHNDRLHQIVWTCSHNEECCGRSCCLLITAENSTNNMKILAMILGVVLIVLLAFCLIYCVYNLNNDERIDIDG
ncbi:hypothetical protein ANCCAN_12685 [Ancylostoma caninum]|uniref:CX domain-containing protein n=1 Tax=Ancylostoma caninum TaxID=29170 RepID=A0A368GAB7_ANCCA|nr:hypothetical protein ANCCAN_12685 [Ancylostoma caninum]